MKVEINTISPTKQQLVIEVPADQVNAEFETLMADLRKEARIPGFRPGKVPDAIIKMRAGDHLNKQVAATLIEKSLPDAMKEIKLKILGSPEIDELEINNNAPYVFHATFEVVPDLEISDYKGIEVSIPELALTDQEISDGLERIRKGQSTYEVVSGRPAQQDDRVFGKLSLSIDGEPVSGWNNRSSDFVVGAGKMFPGSTFEISVIGTPAGSIAEFDVTFDPEYAYYKDFAGKTVHVKLDVNEIKEMKTPPLNDELAVDMGLENLEQLRNNVMDTIRQNKQNHQEDAIRSSIIQKLIDTNSFDVPETLIRFNLQTVASQIHGIESLPSEEIEKLLRKPAENLARKNMILDKIAELEKIEIKEEELDDVFEEELARSRQDRQKMREEWEEHGIFEHVKASILRDKAFDMIRESAKVTLVQPESATPPSAVEPDTQEGQQNE